MENSIRSPGQQMQDDEDDPFDVEVVGGGDQSIMPSGYKAQNKDKDLFNPASAAARHGIIEPNEDIFPEYKNASRAQEETKADFNPFKTKEDVAPTISMDDIKPPAKQDSPKFQQVGSPQFQNTSPPIDTVPAFSQLSMPGSSASAALIKRNTNNQDEAWTRGIMKDLEKVNDVMVDQFNLLQQRLNSMSKNLASTSQRVQRQQIQQMKNKQATLPAVRMPGQQQQVNPSMQQNQFGMNSMPQIPSFGGASQTQGYMQGPPPQMNRYQSNMSQQQPPQGWVNNPFQQQQSGYLTPVSQQSYNGVGAPPQNNMNQFYRR